MSTMGSVGKQQQWHHMLWFQAIFSRVVIIISMAVSNMLITDHNPGVDVAVFSRAGVLSSFSKWDSAYYLRLAQLGNYPVPKLLAFYPTYPFILRYIATCLTTLTSASPSSDVCVIVGAIIVSNVSFLVSVLVLRQVIQELLPTPHDATIQYTAVFSYIWNPASIFFVTAYTESLYAACSFLGIWQLILATKSSNVTHTSLHTLSASYFFLLASSIRSNGLLNIIFALFFGLSILINRSSLLDRAILLVPWTVVTLSTIIPFVVFNSDMHDLVCPAVGPGTSLAYGTEQSCTPTASESASASSSASASASASASESASASASSSASASASCASISAASLLRQSPTNGSIHASMSSWLNTIAAVVVRWLLPARAMFGHTSFASLGAQYQKGASGGEVGDPQHLVACCARGAFGCSMYSAVQRQYWDVGFLRYYRWNQIPNFMLATPIIVVAVCTGTVLATWIWPPVSRGLLLRSDPKQPLPGLLRIVLVQLPWVALAAAHVTHLAAVALVGVTVAHVQISTRLLCSSCPVIYIGFAYLFGSCEGSNWHRFTTINDDGSKSMRADGNEPSTTQITCVGLCSKSVMVAAYMIMFNVLGALLHPNFYPWT